MEQQTMKIQDLTLIALMAALTCILGPMSVSYTHLRAHET